MPRAPTVACVSPGAVSDPAEGRALALSIGSFRKGIAHPTFAFYRVGFFNF